MEAKQTQPIEALLQTSGTDCLVITDPYNMRYLSGFCGGEGVVFLSDRQQILITDSRYTEAAAKESPFTVLEEKASHTRYAILQECLRQEQGIHGGRVRIGYEDKYLTCFSFAKMQRELLQSADWIPLGDAVERLRRIKRPDEIEKLARAEAIGDAAFAAVLPLLSPGITEKEVAAELEYAMKKNGADDLSFSTIVASGIHSSMPHAVPTDKPIEAGDFVTMDFGCIFDGYCSDMTRTVVVGKASDRQKEIYAVVLEAQMRCLDQLKAGMSGNEADALARDVIRAAGYGEYFGHGTGHSVGLYIHEDPRLSPSEGQLLKPGMVVTVEPGIYIPGFGGVRIEDMVVITETGCRNLTFSPK